MRWRWAKSARSSSRGAKRREGSYREVLAESQDCACRRCRDCPGCRIRRCEQRGSFLGVAHSKPCGRPCAAVCARRKGAPCKLVTNDALWQSKRPIWGAGSLCDFRDLGILQVPRARGTRNRSRACHRALFVTKPAGGGLPCRFWLGGDGGRRVCSCRPLRVSGWVPAPAPSVLSLSAPFHCLRRFAPSPSPASSSNPFAAPLSPPPSPVLRAAAPAPASRPSAAPPQPRPPSSHRSSLRNYSACGDMAVPIGRVARYHGRIQSKPPHIAHPACESAAH